MPSFSSTSRWRSTPKPASGGRFDCEIVQQQPGLTVLRVDGPRDAELFMPERGGHRWQRIPPTEKNGRRQSSTVTVAVLPAIQNNPGFNESDVEFRYTTASGPGGQQRQKSATAVIAKHIPSGIAVRVENERSQSQNKRISLEVLSARVAAEDDRRLAGGRNSDRRSQIGAGMRGDKIRTVQMHNGVVTNHLKGTKMPVAKYLKGMIEEIQ